jgi:hypothetical protein
METIFKRNLSAITGNDSLTKLAINEEESIKLAETYELEPDSFDAALFTYFYNVILESNEFCFAVNRKDLIATSSKSLVMYFNDIVIVGEPECELWLYAGNLKNTRALGLIANDMKRLFKIWAELYLTA